MYFADIITIEGRRTFVSADLKTGKIRIEQVSDERFKQFICDMLALKPDQDEAATEVSA